MDDGDTGVQAKPIHVLMAGGGTGGHVFPALAVAAEITARGHTVSWVGRAESMEEALVRDAGLEFHELGARPWVGKGIAAKLGAATTLAVSSWRGRALVRRTGGDVMLGTGGYVSTPAVLGARLAGCPTFVFEPNAKAGAANRLAARWSKAVFVAHETTASDFSCRTHLTGIPVRAAFHAIGPLPAGPPHLLVLGGSQGALQINRLVPEMVSRLMGKSEFEGLTVVHQAGRKHLGSVEAAYDELGVALGDAPGVAVVPFIEDVASAMARAHLVISRAGALATAELAAAGRPAVLIPLLAAAAGHQRFNAERMAAAGAARALTGANLGAGELAEELLASVSSLLTDHARLDDMSRAARSLGNPGAASRIAGLLIEEGGRG